MMIILHYIPSIDKSSGGVGAYMQLLAKDLGKLCELHVVTHKSDDMLQLENCTLHFIPQNNNPFSNKSKKEFVEILDTIHPDIFHTNCCWLPQSARIAMWVKEWNTKQQQEKQEENKNGKNSNSIDGDIYNESDSIEGKHGLTRIKGIDTDNDKVNNKNGFEGENYSNDRKEIKIVYSPHGMLEPWIMKRHYWTKKLPAILLFQKRGIKIADVIHSTADSEKDNLLKLGWNKNITVIGNCVDVDAIKMKKSWKRTKTILFLSRVHVKKGINFFIEAAASLRDELDGYRIKIAGPGDEAYVEELKALSVKLGVQDKVDFIGPVFGDKKFDLYREADLFVLPTHSENFGIVVAEALACGTPVITTKGTPWNELETEHCGWWTEIGAEATVEAVKDFLTKNEEELREMGENGRRLIEEKYDSKRIAKEFVEMYKSI